MKATENRFWVVKANQYAENFRIDFVKRFLYKPIRRKSTAHTWIIGALRLDSDAGIGENLLKKNPDDQYVLEIFRYFERVYGESLQNLTIHSDPQIRDRARKLLKEDKHWDDATFQRWLDSQPNGFSQSNLYSVRH
jgi:hypothetical protein